MQERLSPETNPKEEIGKAQSVITQVYKSHLRIQRVRYYDDNPQKGKAVAVWGLGVFDGLPIVFQAWKVRLGEKRTNPDWVVHMPCNPLEFGAPMFTSPLNNKDGRYILMHFGVSEKKIDREEKMGKLQVLYKKTVTSKKAQYDALRETLNTDPDKRKQFSSAVSLICQEVTSNYPI